MKDRLGNERCEGYKPEEFQACDAPGCKDGKVNNKWCSTCGGYGEFPVPYKKTATNDEIERVLDDLGVMPPELVVAMTIWGEARGEHLGGKRAVANVIHNRAMRRSAKTGFPYLTSTSQVCLAPHQFSCWQNGKFVQEEPDVNSAAWDECLAAAGEIFAESYQSLVEATHYFAIWLKPQPSWAAKMEFVGQIGRHLFYIEDGWRG
jgi:hypothetical protein